MQDTPSAPDRLDAIRALFDEYIEMYASRDHRLTERFSANFSGFAGSGDVLVKDRDEWARVTLQDFAQVPGRIRIEMRDLSLQDLGKDVAMATAFFHIHLPGADHDLSKEVARLVLVFRREGSDWKIAHSGISIPYRRAQEGEVYPLKSLQARNAELEALVAERTRALNESEALHRLLTEDTLDVLWKADRQLRVTYISPSDERLRGFKSEEVLGHSVFEMFTAEGVALVKDLLKQRRAGGQATDGAGFMTFEVEHRCKDGRLIWGEVLSKPDLDDRGAIVGYHGITREITRRKRLEDQVRQLAFEDTLTRLANRRLLMDRLAQALSASKRSRRHAALLFLDLDNFKLLNDAHGHGAGDLLLVEAASRLRECVREMDTVARFGGDEFVVLLGDLSAIRDEAMAHAGAVAAKIHARLSAPYSLVQAQAGAPGATIEHRCSASMGVVVFEGLDASPEDIIDWADTAMYQAKADGRDRIRFHAPPEPS